MNEQLLQVQIVRVHRNELWRIGEIRFAGTIVDVAPWYEPPNDIRPLHPAIMTRQRPQIWMGVDLRIESPIASKCPEGGLLDIELLEDFLHRWRHLNRPA